MQVGSTGPGSRANVEVVLMLKLSVVLGLGKG